jgi:ubiquinone/menaquinone biosynthesis C-methylase UbiE
VDDDTRRVRSAAFAAVADVYERTRPGYPDPAVEWLLGTEPQRVLELGAGTGKLTRSLVARGHIVVATDPSAPMLAELTRTGLPVRTTVARAEHLPFAGQSFDAVVVAQAFHWFDPAAALPEIARVLRPRGTLAVVWNLRDGSVPWVRRLTELLRDSENDATGRMYGSSDEPASMGVVEASPLFGEVESTRHRFWQQLDLAGLLGLVQSRSGVALLGGEERRELVRKVEALYAEYGRDRQGMRLPYVTHSFRTTAAPPPPPPPAPPGGTDDDDLLFDFR